MKKFNELQVGDLVAASVLKDTDRKYIHKEGGFIGYASEFKYRCTDQKWNYFLIDSIDKVWNSDLGEYDLEIFLNVCIGDVRRVRVSFSDLNKEYFKTTECYFGSYLCSYTEDIIETTIVADGDAIREKQKESGLNYWYIENDSTQKS